MVFPRNAGEFSPTSIARPGAAEGHTEAAGAAGVLERDLAMGEFLKHGIILGKTMEKNMRKP